MLWAEVLLTYSYLKIVVFCNYTILANSTDGNVAYFHENLETNTEKEGVCTDFTHKKSFFLRQRPGRIFFVVYDSFSKASYKLQIISLMLFYRCK